MREVPRVSHNYGTTACVSEMAADFFTHFQAVPGFATCQAASVGSTVAHAKRRVSASYQSATILEYSSGESLLFPLVAAGD